MDPQGIKVGLALFGMSATRQPDAADGCQIKTGSTMFRYNGAADNDWPAIHK